MQGRTFISGSREMRCQVLLWRRELCFRAEVGSHVSAKGADVDWRLEDGVAEIGSSDDVDEDEVVTLCVMN